MTTAVLYTRVSSDEQALGFSLKDQVARLREYCKLKSIDIIAEFQDDFTGKTFDRPGFNRMTVFVKKTKVDQILFIKWARFGRNTTDSYVMIDKFHALGIQVQAIDEPVDFNVPQSRLMLALYIANPHVENLIRRGLTMDGMYRAKLEGRYLGFPPAGYKNTKDALNKPTITPDPVKAPFITQAFDLMATGMYTQHEVRMQLKKDGFEISRSRLFDILHNQVYAGYIHVPAHRNEKAKLVKGIYTPIVSEETFYKVQDVLNGNKRKHPKKQRKIIPELPLRGFLYCNTFDHKMTGSCSVGHGGRYHYYHCPNECHCERWQASAVEDGLVRQLQKRKINPRTCEHIIKTLEYMMKPNPSEAKALQNKIAAQKQDIRSLIDQRVRQEISLEDYNETRARYQGILANLETDLELITTQEKEFAGDLAECMDKVPNIAEIYLKTEPELKPNLLSSILKHKLYFDGNECRTSGFSPFIDLLTSGTAINEKRTNEMHSLVLSSSPPGTVSRTFSPASIIRLDIQQLARTFKLLRA